jgi:HEAT repeats
VRAAVCSALTGYPGDVAWPLLARGLADRDATVRASCLAATHVQRTAPTQRAAAAAQRTALTRLRGLSRDRDSTVRAASITSLAVLDPAHLPDASSDRSADVRRAYATALAASLPRDLTSQLHALADDRDPDVRAAAWTTLASATPDSKRSSLAVHAAADAAAQVRQAAVRAIDDDELLLRLAKYDDAAEVRTAALVELAGRRGRAASTDLLLQRLAEATPGTGERVRTALAWLLAR